jgi:tetratricopeptide (TPR) repeat protein
MTVDGGGLAAFGFRYQYLVAVEDFLHYVVAHPDDAGETSLIVEPTRVETEDADGDPEEVVDYAIVLRNEVVRRVQVKASKQPSALRPLRPGVATTIFDRMSKGRHGDTADVIRTNKPLSKKLAQKCTLRSEGANSLQTYEYQSAAQDGADRLIEHDSRPTAAVKSSILELIRDVRRDNALGQGTKSAGVLMAVALDRIFDSAADMAERTISAESLLRLLGTTDNDLAHVLREFDWGAPLVEVPRLTSPVPRTTELVELSVLFEGSVTSRAPSIAVLSGVTGFGKSTIAADFCHLNRHLYEKIAWIDCRETPLIESKVKDTLRRMNVQFDAESDVASLFRTAIATLPGPVVLVFDGVQDREQIEPFVPTSGCGFVIVTSTNSASWWTAAIQLHVEAFSTEEAIRCFGTYANIDPEQHRDTVTAVVERLERVPLAIAMAGLYFRDSSDDVSALAADYFSRLDALDDPAFRPEGFDRTAFAAVKLAVTQLGKAKAGSSEDRLQAQALVYHSSFLAPELIPFNLILQTVEAINKIDLRHPPRPEIADRHRRNVIMANLQTQTIARRRQYAERAGAEGPASDTLNIHPLVHEILRTIHTQGVPARDLLGLLAGLMGCVYGWLYDMRHEGDFFPVDQLLMHSDYLLAIVDQLDLADAPEDEIYVYRCAKAFLRSEAANGYSSRGQYERSMAMIERALTEVAGMDLSPFARITIADAAANGVTDALLGGLGVARALPLAERALEELKAFEIVDQRAVGEMAYLCAFQTAEALRRFGSPDTKTAAVLEQLEQLAGRQQRSASITGMMQTILADIKAGRLVPALTKIESTRRAAPSAPNQIMLDFYTAIALTHLGRFDEAADTIERILRADTGRHLAYAFGSMYVALNTGLSHEHPKWRRSRAAARLEELHAEVKRRAA